MTKQREWSDPDIGGSVMVFSGNQVALCVLWNFLQTIREKLEQYPSVDHNPFGAVGNVRTFTGISWVLRGLFAQELININELILWGSDKERTAEMMLALWQDGVDENHCIIGFEQMGPLDSLIDLNAINELREKVVLTDKRGINFDELIKSYSLKNKADEPNRQVREFPPVEVPELLPLPSRGIALSFYADSIFMAWLQLVNAIIRCGHRKVSRKGEKLAHLFSLSVTFPSNEIEIDNRFGISSDDLDNYFDLNFKRVTDEENLRSNEYNYGDRIHRWDGDREKLKDLNFQGFDQFGACIERLRKSADTKRSTVVLLGPTDLEELEDAPCFVEFTLAIENGELIGSYVFRSHDIFKGWPRNLLAITRKHREAAEQLGVKPGLIHIISQNAQIYERFFEEALKILKDHFFNLDRRREFMSFRSDPAGNFVFRLSLENNKPLVRAQLTGSNGVLFEVEHTDPEMLVNWLAISFSWLDPQHIVYLGKEMEKMRRAIETSEEYIQG